MKITCNEPSIQNKYNLCRSYQDVSVDVTVPAVTSCVPFGSVLETDFVGRVDANDILTYSISLKSKADMRPSACGICLRHSDFDSIESAGWSCAQIGNSAKVNFYGVVDGNDDLDVKLSCDVLYNN
jgi:hypothetical protein